MKQQKALSRARVATSIIVASMRERAAFWRASATATNTYAVTIRALEDAAARLEEQEKALRQFDALRSETDLNDALEAANAILSGKDA